MEISVKKVTFIILIAMIILISSIGVSFGVSAETKYAESYDELVQAEIFLNSVVHKIQVSQAEELNLIDVSKIKTVEEKRILDDLISKNRVLNGYIKLRSERTIDSINIDIVESSDFSMLCKEIEAFKDANPSSNPKEIVKYFNSKAGLQEKPDKKPLLSLSILASVNALSYSDWTNLTTAEKLLVASDPVSALITNSCKEKAYQYTKDKFGYNGLGDKSDGYRHGIWNALMSRDISKAWAEAYATAHEAKSQTELNQKAADGYYEYQHRDMDLHNNQEGRDCVAWYDLLISDSTIRSRVSAKLTNISSDIIWLHS